MEKRQVLRKGQVLRGYFRAGTRIIVLRGKLHLQYAPHYMGECLLQQTQVLFEGECELIEEAGRVSLAGDEAEIHIIDTSPVRRWAWKIQALLAGF
ncbi:hypothetical protein [Iodobacter fluviatilis]|uniref:Uncharacterized protein n=1 Tax=Iodobacter fluviatilis TaxID=537 RepID=A0A377Q4N2_9NEIS|nr:hypothetical protein [Iodobacter fluviatilis]TCU84153.1 hypothetical protein EV682_11092 [Iodobacter fluviatilis]STQ89767.1 Uncharacterised protein [Iodobacter fluviatilis]